LEIQKIVKNILNKTGIFYKENGFIFEVSYDQLLWEGPMHSKAICRIYIEKMEENGGSFIKIIGAITEPLKKHEVVNMSLVDQYYDKKERKYQVWINNDDIENVKVLIPRGFKATKKSGLPTLKTKKKNQKVVESYLTL
jgi:hypothetical protein